MYRDNPGARKLSPMALLDNRQMRSAEADNRGEKAENRDKGGETAARYTPSTRISPTRRHWGEGADKHLLLRTREVAIFICAQSNFRRCWFDKWMRMLAERFSSTMTGTQWNDLRNEDGVGLVHGDTIEWALFVKTRGFFLCKQLSRPFIFALSNP